MGLFGLEKRRKRKLRIPVVQRQRRVSAVSRY